jgi:hypothetical protein
MSASLSWYTPEIDAVQARHRGQVAALFAARSPGGPLAISAPWFGSSHGLAGTNEIDMLAQPGAWLREVLADMAENGPAAALNPVTYRPLVIDMDAWGVHFIDALFGARVFFHAGQVWNEELRLDLADLQAPDLQASRLMQQALRLACLAVDASGGKLLVAMPVLSCAINVGINLFGERLLEAMASRPEVSRRALAIVNDTIRQALRMFAQVIPPEVRRCSVSEDRYMPPGFGFIDGCATQLISARHYREVIMPLDRAVLAESPNGGMIHLCGAHAHLIPAFASMPELRAVQINDRAVEDLAAFHSGLRQDQILYVSPSLAWPVERILEATRGKRVILQAVPSMHL